MPNRIRLLVLGAAALAVTAVCFSKPPMRQHPSYHNFADQRTFLGVPNCLDVVSNLPFLFVGIWGLVVLMRPESGASFLTDSEKCPYAVLFLGVALTFFGSSYYHLHPTNATLVWDRLPMALGFTGILAATVAERISLRAGNLLLLPLAIAGVLSVIYWYWTEGHGQGDLRPYFLVQFGALLSVLVILALFDARYTHTWCLALALALYAVAKVLETLDPNIYSLGHVVSGHTLKHIAAAAAVYLVLLMLQRRTLIIDSHRHSTVSASLTVRNPLVLGTPAQKTKRDFSKD